MKRALSLSQSSAKAKRAWLRAHGYLVPTRGRLSSEWLDLYEQWISRNDSTRARGLGDMFDALIVRIDETLDSMSSEEATYRLAADLENICIYDPEFGSAIASRIRRDYEPDEPRVAEMLRFIDDLLEHGEERDIQRALATSDDKGPSARARARKSFERERAEFLSEYVLASDHRWHLYYFSS